MIILTLILLCFKFSFAQDSTCVGSKLILNYVSEDEDSTSLYNLSAKGTSQKIDTSFIIIYFERGFHSSSHDLYQIYINTTRIYQGVLITDEQTGNTGRQFKLNKDESNKLRVVNKVKNDCFEIKLDDNYHQLIVNLYNKSWHLEYTNQIRIRE